MFRVPILSMKIFMRFVENDYESKWFENASFASHIFENEISKVADEIDNDKTKIVVWGSGKYGKALMAAIEKTGTINIEYIVDINEAKDGSKICGKEIMYYKNVDFSEVEVGVVSAKNATEFITNYLSEYKIQIIDVVKIFDL